MEYRYLVHGTADDCADSWPAAFEVLERTGPFTEMRFIARGSSIHAVVGPQVNGNFICIPAFNVGSELSELGDAFWNTERLSPLIGDVDAATVAQGLLELSIMEKGRLYEKT